MFKKKTNETINESNETLNKEDLDITLEDIFYLLSLVADKLKIDFDEEDDTEVENEANDINEFLKSKGLSDEDIATAMEIIDEYKTNEVEDTEETEEQTGNTKQKEQEKEIDNNEDEELENLNSIKRNSVIQKTLASIGKYEPNNFKSRLQRIAEANNKYKLNR